MEHQGPRSERAKNKGLISSPGALRGRCAITKSQRPWHKWKRQKQGPDPWIRKCLRDDGEAVLKKGQVNERGHTGSSRDQEGLRGDLLADGEGVRCTQRWALGSPGVVAVSLSPKGVRQRGDFYPPHFPIPLLWSSASRKRFSRAGSSSSELSQSLTPTLVQALSSLRAGIQVTKLTRPGLQMVRLHVGYMLKQGPLLGQAPSL